MQFLCSKNEDQTWSWKKSASLLSEEFYLLIAFKDLCHELYVTPPQTSRVLPPTAGSDYP